jgi:hypothetical protein
MGKRGGGEPELGTQTADFSGETSPRDLADHCAPGARPLAVVTGEN